MVSLNMYFIALHLVTIHPAPNGTRYQVPGGIWERGTPWYLERGMMLEFLLIRLFQQVYRYVDSLLVYDLKTHIYTFLPCYQIPYPGCS